MASQRAPIIIIQRGIPALLDIIPPEETVSYIAANGPIAFATSFAPCANERSAAENTRGILKSLLIDFLEFLKRPENLNKSFRTTIYVRRAMSQPTTNAILCSI